MKNVAFIWPWERASQIMPHWRDGHRKVIELLAQKHNVDWFIEGKCPPDAYDFYLIWDDSSSLAIEKLKNHKGKKGLMLTTDPYDIVKLKKYNVVYAESDPVVEMCKPYVRTIKAMGTDTEFYKPDKNVVKNLQVFYPATFSPWKRQEIAAEKYGDKLLCVGTLQPDGNPQLEACKKYGSQVKVGYFPAEQIRDYYNRAAMVTIPAIHGSERTVLEAMSMDLLPNVPMENKKAYSYIDEYFCSNIESPRKFVRKYYSEFVYLDQLLKGIEQ